MSTLDYDSRGVVFDKKYIICNNKNISRIDKQFDATPDDINRYNFALSTMRKLGASAAETIRNGEVKITIKADGTTVTNVDREIEERFTELINQQYGDEDIVLGEEFSDANAPIPEDKRIWRFDPFDGTGWLRQMIEAGDTDYSKLRALILAAHFRPTEIRPVFGIMHSPFYENNMSTMTALDGKSYHYDLGRNRARQVRVNPYAETDIRSVMRYEKNGVTGAVQDVGEGEMRELMPSADRIKLPLFMGNIALHDIDVSVYPAPTQSHDVAVGALTVVNAGGVVKDFGGQTYDQIDWRKSPLNGVVAGPNESLVNQVIAHYAK